VGFYKFGNSFENFPSIRITLEDGEGSDVYINLISLSKSNLAMNVQVFAFLAQNLTSTGYTIAFSK
jgi:hypothetical protein